MGELWIQCRAGLIVRFQQIVLQGSWPVNKAAFPLDLGSQSLRYASVVAKLLGAVIILELLSPISSRRLSIRAADLLSTIIWGICLIWSFWSEYAWSDQTSNSLKFSTLYVYVSESIIEISSWLTQNFLASWVSKCWHEYDERWFIGSNYSKVYRTTNSFLYIQTVLVIFCFSGFNGNHSGFQHTRVFAHTHTYGFLYKD